VWNAISEGVNVTAATSCTPDASCADNLPAPSVPSSDSHLETSTVADDSRTKDSPDSPECVPTSVTATPVNRCGSVGFTLGTPLALEVAEDDPNSDYRIATQLPDRSLFAVGVSDHILYENLPNATGTFQRLRGVIRTLRETGKPQQRENSSRATPDSVTRH
jgi:hypothetical protein